MKKTFRIALLTSTLLSGAAWAEDVTLTIESWRNDDLTIWQDKLIPAFEAANPGIKVVFAPTAPAEYNAALNSKLAAGSAGDLITCRPFDASLELYNQGNLADLSGLAAMANFSPVAKSAWQTDDGSATFCVPMASVIHGFIYNKDAFDALGITPPATVDEFFAALDKIKADGTYIPMAMGTNDQWEAATMGYNNIGPNYWKGEEGRKALIAGKKKFTDPDVVSAWEHMARWAPYLSRGYQAQTYGDSQVLFASGRAAIYPTGSWDISYFQNNGMKDFGAFAPPVRKAGDTCHISDHTDIGMGVNSASKNKADAEKFLTWLASREFADLYTNKVTGFFSLSKHPITVQDPVAREMLGWRQTCKSTIRLNAQIMSRGTPSMENELWTVSSQVMNGKMTPKAAAERIQAGFEKWHKPAGL